MCDGGTFRAPDSQQSSCRPSLARTNWRVGPCMLRPPACNPVRTSGSGFHSSRTAPPVRPRLRGYIHPRAPPHTRRTPPNRDRHRRPPCKSTSRYRTHHTGALSSRRSPSIQAQAAPRRSHSHRRSRRPAQPSHRDRPAPSRRPFRRRCHSQ
jgi:hypothetical protein